ncbi:15435_t:CDS:2, partial [Racocetra fulgida]
MRTKKKYEEEEAYFQNEFVKKRKTNNKISINDVKLAIKSITPNQVQTSSLISTKKRKRYNQFWSTKSQSNTKNINYAKSDNHKNKVKLDNINNDDHFENNEYIDHFEDNEYDHFENNYDELLTALQLLTPHSTVRSLAMNDNFEAAELHQFLIMRNLECELNIGTEDFPGEMMKPKKIQVALPDDIYNLLIDYYNNWYKSNFVSI